MNGELNIIVKIPKNNNPNPNIKRRPPILLDLYDKYQS